MSIANGLFLIIFMQRNGFILQYIFNSITKKHRFINGWFKLKDQSINRCFFVIEVKMYLSYIPLLINLFFCMKVMRERRQYPILMHPLYGIKVSWDTNIIIVCIKKMTLSDIIAIYVIYLSNCKTNCTYYICTCSSQCQSHRSASWTNHQAKYVI